jgi:multiple sugar transport system substrate-binding protein
MAKAMQSKGGAKWGIYLQPGKTGSWQTLMPFGWSNGASIADDKSYTFDSPQMTEALAYYQSFFTQKLSPTDLPNGQLEPDFGKGAIGSFVSGPWEAALVDQQGAKGKYAVVPLPAKQSSTSFIGGSNIAVFKDAKNRDAAWKFVQWLSKPEVQVKWYGLVKDLPAVQKSWDDQTLTGDAVLATFGEQLKDAKSPPAIATWEQVAAVIDGEVEKVAKSGADPAAAAKTMQQRASGIGTGV